MSKDLLAELRPLIDDAPPAELGPGPRAGVLSEAEINRRVDTAFERHGRPRKAELVRSLILLWHDHLDASHQISQSVPNSDGSFVHGIMHRREPDYSNAKYWWRSTGRNPCFPGIAANVGNLGGIDDELRDRVLSGGDWDPFAFTDAVAAGIRESASSSAHQALVAIQKAETDTLLAHLLD